MPLSSSKNKQYFTRSTKRNQEVDKNRKQDLGDPTVEPPSRRKARESLRGRRDLTVLPHTNTPLFGIEDETDGSNLTTMPNPSDLQNFNVGIGDANGRELASALEVIPEDESTEFNDPRTSSSLRMDLPRRKAHSEEKTHSHTTPSLDPITEHLVKEMILKAQQETMPDIIKNLTDVFRETLRVESQSIVRQITTNNTCADVSSNRNAAPSAGDQSQFRLHYRDPRVHENQSNSNINFANPNHGRNNNRFQQPPFEQPPINRRNLYANVPNNLDYHHQRIHLDKWGLQFDGSNMSVDDFIFRVECKQSTSNYSWAEIYNDFNNLLSGPAEHWYWVFRRNNPQADYTAFKLALAERYPSKDSDVDLWRKLINRKQKPGESFDDFVDNIERIYYRMAEQPTDQQLVNVIRDNLNSDISTHIGLNRTNSLVALKYIAREAEKLAAKLKPVAHNKSYSRYVSEVAESDCCDRQEDHIFLEAFTAQNKKYKIYKCKHCSKKFRVDEENDVEKELYCYSCGKEGYTKLNCPDCSGNQKKSE